MASAVPVGTLKKRNVSNVRQNHFTCQNMETEWTLTDADGINYIISQLLLNTASWSEMNKGIREVQAVVNKNENMWPVRSFLENARRTNDVTYLLRAYTVQCDFYRILNKTLAERVDVLSMGNPIKSLLNLILFDEDNKTPNNDWPLCFAGPIFDDIFSRNHRRYQFKGHTYRGARISRSELDKYVAGKLIFNKAFTSTSKQRDIAKRFYRPENQKHDNKKAALFIFLLNNTDTNFVIDLHGISAFPDEEEVLVMPGIPFTITKVEDGNPIEIQLQQATISHLLGRRKKN